MVTLRPFSSVDLRAMRWIRSAGDRREFLLESGDAPLARLEWASAVGSLAHATTSSEHWTLKRGGFLRPFVTVRTDAAADVARMEVHATGGVLTTPAGFQATFRRSGLLVPAWQFADSSGRPVLHLEPVTERRRLAGGLVQADVDRVSEEELRLLVLVGWYAIVLAWFEDEAVLATTSALSAIS